jgi:signal transduction histidine kinase
VINAEEAMPNGGQIVFQTRPSVSGVELELIDTGVGMDQEVLSRIFRPFFSTRKDGSGLGLPTARRIIEAHGGSIRVESAVGKGTRFTIALPAGQDNQRPANAERRVMEGS